MSLVFPPGVSAAGRARLEADVGAFLSLVSRAITPDGVLPGFFDAGSDVTLGRAPGRLDVMGGIADYSGSLVLELPLADATLVAAQPSEDGVVRVASFPPDGGPLRVMELPRAELRADYADVRRAVTSRLGDVWGGYVAGCLTALDREHSIHAGARGVRFIVGSSVPEGGGISSSAALTVATTSALLGLESKKLVGSALALTCQKVENLVVGAPSGVMDPMTAALGQELQLLALLCQPAIVEDQLEVPPRLALLGIDSEVRHVVRGADYRSVRVAAFMGYRIIAELAGLPVTLRDGVASAEDARFEGYLANVGVPELEARYLRALPERLSGAEFLARYGGITDRVTAVEPDRTYLVRAATAHPIREHARVRRFAALLRGPLRDDDLDELGDLMRAANESYAACGLGSEGTDRLVSLVREAGPASGLIGAKVTGGGLGGTVAILARAGSDEAVRRVAAQYGTENNGPARVFRGSSPGAASFGALRLRPDGRGERRRLEIVS